MVQRERGQPCISSTSSRLNSSILYRSAQSFRAEDLMKMRATLCHLLVVMLVFETGFLQAQTQTSPTARHASHEAMDRDLLEITIPKLEQLYTSHKYTVTEVVRWYVARIERYNGIYRAVQNLDLPGALATAAREDAEAKAAGGSFVRGPLWGVPIVTKANTSIKD